MFGEGGGTPLPTQADPSGSQAQVDPSGSPAPEAEVIDEATIRQAQEKGIAPEEQHRRNKQSELDTLRTRVQKFEDQQAQLAPVLALQEAMARDEVLRSSILDVVQGRQSSGQPSAGGPAETLLEPVPLPERPANFSIQEAVDDPDSPSGKYMLAFNDAQHTNAKWQEDQYKRQVASEAATRAEAEGQRQMKAQLDAAAERAVALGVPEEKKADFRQAIEKGLTDPALVEQVWAHWFLTKDAPTATEVRNEQRTEEQRQHQAARLNVPAASASTNSGGVVNPNSQMFPV